MDQSRERNGKNDSAMGAEESGKDKHKMRDMGIMVKSKTKMCGEIPAISEGG